MKLKFFIFFILMSFISSINSFSLEKNTKKGIEEGNKVIEFSITDLNGNRVDSKNLTGKTVILHFWASWCPPCKEELPEYDKFYMKNKNNFVFLTVSVDNSSRDLKKFLKKNNFSFNVYHDTKGISRKFLVRAIPTTYIISDNGIIMKKIIGSITWNRYTINQIKRGEL